jgi:hypothetical protein
VTSLWLDDNLIHAVTYIPICTICREGQNETIRRVKPEDRVSLQV